MRSALIIGNARYSDQILAQLKTPSADVRALADILCNPDIGGFDEVTPVIDRTQREIGVAILNFLKSKKLDDLALLYFSGHGVLDSHGQLYLATADTVVEELAATAIPASFVIQRMDDCRAKKQLLILDCCHSGAFAEGTTKGAEQKAITEASFQTERSGFGRIVLTASDAMQCSWEGSKVVRQTDLSLFTHFLLEGLRTGKADADADGWITLDEWYEYAYEQVVSQTPKQVPQKWTYRQQGDMVIARNPFLKSRASTTAASVPAAKPTQVTPQPVQPAQKPTNQPAGTLHIPPATQRIFDSIKPKVCGFCGRVVSPLDKGVFVCTNCGKYFHFTCVDVGSSIVGQSSRIGTPRRDSFAGVELKCRFCHLPVVPLRTSG